jgi:hypothetical protein
MSVEVAPSVLSARFHLQYFPALLWRRIGPRAADEPRVSFSNHGSLEQLIILIVCATAVVIGLPFALQGSVTGIIGAGIGAVGVAGVIVVSVMGAGASAGFAGFRCWVFCAVVLLGVTVGLFAGSLEHSHTRALVYAAIGLAAGYPLGILAGLFAQRLGWIAGLLDSLAMVALLGLIVVDIVLAFL